MEIGQNGVAMVAVMGNEAFLFGLGDRDDGAMAWSESARSGCVLNK